MYQASRRSIFLTALLALLAMSLVVPVSASAAPLYSAYKLEKQKTAVPYGETVTIWACWDPGYTAPSLYAWTGRSWSRWSKGQLWRDDERCDKGADYVEFTFRVTQPGRPVEGKRFNLLKVKETCRGCDPYVWNLPVIPAPL
jgi:hypothetical protein